MIPVNVYHLNRSVPWWRRRWRVEVDVSVGHRFATDTYAAWTESGAHRIGSRQWNAFCKAGRA